MSITKKIDEYIESKEERIDEQPGKGLAGVIVISGIYLAIRASMVAVKKLKDKDTQKAIQEHLDKIKKATDDLNDKIKKMIIAK